MAGGTGDDTMCSGSGDDEMFGQDNDDNMNGNSGHDTVVGVLGADILKGSSGNDKIYHGFLNPDISLAILPDGSKDTIDGGVGNDEAFINVNQDGDTAVNCETVHAG